VTQTYSQSVLQSSPSVYLPLNDAAGTTTLTNQGTAGGSYTPSSVSFGTSGGAVGGETSASFG
jgi:hypothetical protein